MSGDGSLPATVTIEHALLPEPVRGIESRLSADPFAVCATAESEKKRSDAMIITAFEVEMTRFISKGRCQSSTTPATTFGQTHFSAGPFPSVAYDSCDKSNNCSPHRLA